MTPLEFIYICEGEHLKWKRDMIVQAKSLTYLVSPHLKKGKRPNIKKLFEGLTNAAKKQGDGKAAVHHLRGIFTKPSDRIEKAKAITDDLKRDIDKRIKLRKVKNG